MTFCSKCNNIYEISQSNTSDDSTNELNNQENYQPNKYNNTNIKAKYICRICGHKATIIPGTILFARPSEQIVKKYCPINTNKIYDPTYPVTRNYICPNTVCESHKDPTKREAIFYRIPTTYDVQYICKTCTFTWNI